MRAWSGLGRLISSHMYIFAPLCVTLGILFPAQLGLLRPLVVPLFAFVTFQGALANTFSSFADVARRPWPLFMILGVASVVMPLLAFGAGSLFFGSDPNIVAGIVIEYCVPVAVVSIVWTSMLEGNMALALSAVLVSTVLAPFTISATLTILLGQSVSISMAGIMRDLVFEIALPALAGVIANDSSHGRAKERLSPVLMPAARIAILVVIATNATGIAGYMRNLTPELVSVTLFILCFAGSGYVLGFLISRALGEDRANIVTSTFQCGMRNISAGAVIAAEYFPPETLFPVVIGTLFQQVLAAFYGKLAERVLSKDSAGEKDTR